MLKRREFIEFFEENKDKFDDNEILVEEIKDAPNKYGTKIFLIKELAQYPDEHDEYCFEISFTTVIIDRKRKDVCDRKYFHYCGKATSALGLWNCYKYVVNTYAYIILHTYRDQFKFYYNDFIKNIKDRIKNQEFKDIDYLYVWHFDRYINFKLNIKVDYLRDYFYFTVEEYPYNENSSVTNKTILQSFKYKITDTCCLKQIYKKIKKKILYELYNLNLTRRI